MSTTYRDRIAGAILLGVSVVWVVLVYTTIPPSQGTLVGPRGFPLFFGLALAGLSLLLILNSFRQPVAVPQAPARPERQPPKEMFSALASVAAIVIYGMMLEPLGFLPATTLIVAAMMIVILRIKGPVMIAAMALGVSLGCYLIFGKLLGTYLPPGDWINLSF